MSVGDSGYLIPDDWDEASWLCVQLWWPKSEAWKSILLGFLSAMARGRTWDAESGTITDAQEWGREIWELNYPLNMCDTPGSSLEREAAAKLAFEVWQEFDGTVASIADDVPDTYYGLDSGDDTAQKRAARRAALCNAINRYIRTLFEQRANQIRNAGYPVAAILGLVGSIPGIIAAATVLGAATLWADALNDDAAIRRLVCCMYGHLVHSAVTRANFLTAPGDCGFSFPSNEAQLAGYLGGENQWEANWHAFVRILGDEYKQAFFYESVPLDCMCPGSCEETPDWEQDGRQGWYLDYEKEFGLWVDGVGWRSEDVGTGLHQLYVNRLCQAETTIWQTKLNFYWDGADATGSVVYCVLYDEDGDPVYSAAKAANNGWNLVTWQVNDIACWRVAFEVHGQHAGIDSRVDMADAELIVQ